jgi:hypothetical protein
LNIRVGGIRILTRTDTVMAVTLDLPQKLVDELSDEAARRGLSLSEYTLRVLSMGRERPQELQTGADLVAYWRSEGLVGSRPEIEDSQAFAREIRRAAERQNRA